jgi:hypothetical protein
LTWATLCVLHAPHQRTPLPCHGWLARLASHASLALWLPFSCAGAQQQAGPDPQLHRLDPAGSHGWA